VENLGLHLFPSGGDEEGALGMVIVKVLPRPGSLATRDGPVVRLDELLDNVQPQTDSFAPARELHIALVKWLEDMGAFAGRDANAVILDDESDGTPRVADLKCDARGRRRCI